jgi:hypothetical protein
MIQLLGPGHAGFRVETLEGVAEATRIHTLLFHPGERVFFRVQIDMLAVDGREHGFIQALEFADAFQCVVHARQIGPGGATERHRHLLEHHILGQFFRPARHQGVEVAAMRATPGKEFQHLDPAGAVTRLRRQDRHPGLRFVGARRKGDGGQGGQGKAVELAAGGVEGFEAVRHGGSLIRI